MSEPASLEITLLGTLRSATLSRAGDLVLAERALPLSAATRSVRLKPRRRLVGRSRRFTVRLRVKATDAAGNSRTVTKRVRVRP